MARGRGSTAGQGDLFSMGDELVEASARKTSSKGKKKPAKKSPPKKVSNKKASSKKDSSEKAPAKKAPRKGGGGGSGGGGGRRKKKGEGKHREISVSEFFTKNRHLLGFDSPTRALLTAVKEAVDNALDACEEARILPDIIVELTEVGENRYRIAVEDNGPGIGRLQIPRIFGSLLYGSKFHAMKQSRGQQGIGISAAGMYGQLTTGKPVVIFSKQKRKPAHHFELVMDTAKNKPKILKDEEIEWEGRSHGTRVALELEGTYRRGQRSVDEYMALTAMANPHADIRYTGPKDPEIHYPRQTKDLPFEPKEIKPHPYGVELGALIKILHETKARNLSAALQKEFSRVSPKVAKEICDAAGLRPTMRPAKVATADAEKLYKAIPKVKILNPPTNCISPIGEELMLKGLLAGLETMELEPDFTTSTTRSPAIYRGNPFQVEVALAWGGNIPADNLAQVNRIANRVPLQYQAAACAITKSVIAAGWKNYGVQQSRGALPTGPLIISVHIASVWVPFTSEAKEAIASYDEILKELRLALQYCGRQLGKYIKRRRKAADEQRKLNHIETFIPVIGDALQEILGFSDKDREHTVEELTGILYRSRKN